MTTFSSPLPRVAPPSGDKTTLLATAVPQSVDEWQHDLLAYLRVRRINCSLAELPLLPIGLSRRWVYQWFKMYDDLLGHLATQTKAAVKEKRHAVGLAILNFEQAVSTTLGIPLVDAEGGKFKLLDTKHVRRWAYARRQPSTPSPGQPKVTVRMWQPAPAPVAADIDNDLPF